MPLDLRRFIVHDWRILEAQAHLSVRLAAVWRDRLGYVPPFTRGAVSGWHFIVPGGRAFTIARPRTTELPRYLRAQVINLIAAKHHVEVVRLASRDEIPHLRPAARIPEPADVEAVEEFPSLEPEWDEQVLIEFAFAPGQFVSADKGSSWPWAPSTDRIEEAVAFESAAEAAEWVTAAGMNQLLALRSLGAARAAADQRQAAWLDDGTV